MKLKINRKLDNSALDRKNILESERAKIMRSLILDIVIDVLSKKAGGNTKYAIYSIFKEH